MPALSRNQLRSARRLLRRRGRQESGLFLVEGAQAVGEALRYGQVTTLLVDDPARHADLVALAGGVEVLRVTPADARMLSDTVTCQGIWAIAQDVRCELAQFGPGPRLVVICVQIRDPGNAGTVIRCADAFGADAVIFTTDSVEVTNPKTVRSSVGSIFHLPIVTDVAFDQALDWARAQGLTTCAADTGGVGLGEMAANGSLARPIAWVMGNEAWGLPAEQLGRVDQIVAIEMWGRAESLNLSTAAAICLYATAGAQHGIPRRLG